MPERGRGPVGGGLSLLQRIANLQRAREGGVAPAGERAGDPRAGEDPRVRRLEERVEHLESELEGLQDAVHREAVRHNERITELEQKVSPETMSRALSEDARERGL